jgi:hypothetical protein
MAQALLPAASALLPTLAARACKGIEMVFRPIAAARYDELVSWR